MATHQVTPSLGFSRENTGVGCHFLLQCMEVKTESEAVHSCPTLTTSWTAAHQAPLSMGFSRQQYWSELPFPPPGDLPNSGIKPVSPALAGRFFPPEPPGKPYATAKLTQHMHLSQEMVESQSLKVNVGPWKDNGFWGLRKKVVRNEGNVHFSYSLLHLKCAVLWAFEAGETLVHGFTFNI